MTCREEENRVAGRSDGRRAGAWVLIFLVFSHSRFSFLSFFCFPFYSLLCHCACFIRRYKAGDSSPAQQQQRHQSYANIHPLHVHACKRHMAASASASCLCSVPVQSNLSVMLLMKQPANGQPRHRIGSRPHPRLGRSNARL